MKTDQITAQQMAARLATASPINPLFTECLNQLRVVFHAISRECYATNGKLKEDYTQYFLEYSTF